MKPLYDAIIVGAGPAGSTLATRLARQGFQVALLEKARFPRDKVCGEFIHPSAVPHFEDIGLGRLLAKEGTPISHLCLSSLQGRTLQIPFPNHSGYSISRRTLDTLLWKQAQRCGVQTRQAFRTDRIDRLNRKQWFLAGRDLRDGRRHSIVGRVVVGADGVRSFVARMANLAYPRQTSAFGAKIHAAGLPGPHHRIELYLIQRGYAGIVNLRGGNLNICALLNRTAITKSSKSWSQLARTTLSANPVLRSRLKEIEPSDPPLFVGPMPYGVRRGRKQRLLVGDAKGIVDQFTGSGILLAVRSASRLAELMERFYRKGSSLLTLIARYETAFRALFHPVEWSAHAVRFFISQPERAELLLQRANDDERLARSLAAAFLNTTGHRPGRAIKYLLELGLRAGSDFR